MSGIERLLLVLLLLVLSLLLVLTLLLVLLLVLALLGLVLLLVLLLVLTLLLLVLVLLLGLLVLLVGLSLVVTLLVLSVLSGGSASSGVGLVTLLVAEVLLTSIRGSLLSVQGMSGGTVNTSREGVSSSLLGSTDLLTTSVGSNLLGSC